MVDILHCCSPIRLQYHFRNGTSGAVKTPPGDIPERIAHQHGLQKAQSSAMGDDQYLFLIISTKGPLLGLFFHLFRLLPALGVLNYFVIVNLLVTIIVKHGNRFWLV